MFLTSGGMGTMGFGLPAAIGAQVANPERLVIDIDGDGSLRMNFGEMETATTYNLPLRFCYLTTLVMAWYANGKNCILVIASPEAISHYIAKIL